MKYFNGLEANLGDKVALGKDAQGEVVCSIDTGEYSAGYPRHDWEYLKHGILVNFPNLGLIHYEQAEPDLHLLERVTAKLEK